MASAKCATCGKTAYPLESTTVGDKSYHKLCFKCSVCSGPLNPKSYKVVAGVIYCFTHTPVDRSTAIDSVANKAAMNAPKKNTEGLGVVQRAPTDGSAPKIGLDSVVNRTAVNAPRQGVLNQAGIHKGDPVHVGAHGAPVNAEGEAPAPADQ